MDFCICYDFVFCIDTGLAMSSCFEKIKTIAKKLIDNIEYYASVFGYSNYELRAKIMTFGDIGERIPIEQGEFYNLKERSDEFLNCFDNLHATGKSMMSNGLEAIATAIKDVNWTDDGARRRHAILLFTNRQTLRFGQRIFSKFYPKDMPKDLRELGEWWEGEAIPTGSNYQPKGGRLMVFAPNDYPWNEIVIWNRYWPVFSSNLSDLDDSEAQQAFDIVFGDI